MDQVIGAVWLLLVGMRGLLGVSARWPPSRWSLIVRRVLAVIAIAYAVVLLVTAFV